LGEAAEWLAEQCKTARERGRDDGDAKGEVQRIE